METNFSDIYAAGDCVETWHKVLQSYTYLPLGTVAHKQGRIAGENIVGGNKEFAGTLGTQSVRIFDKVVARTGLKVSSNHSPHNQLRICRPGASINGFGNVKSHQPSVLWEWS